MVQISFAHLADIHLGSFREKRLKELNIKQFQKTISKIIEMRFDFVLISGDIFNVPLPPLEYVDLVICEMNKLKQNNIEIFVIGGSHDYSLTHKSFIEILDSAGVWRNVGKWNSLDSSSIELEPTTINIKGLDINLYGVLGKKNGLDSKIYSKLKSESIKSSNSKNSFEIFMFHSTIQELLPNHLKKVNEKSQFVYSKSILPKQFDYYAGGHIHHPTIQKIESGKSNCESFISYSGPIFPNSFAELKDKFSGFNECLIDYNESENSYIFHKPNYIKLPLIDITTISIDTYNESVEELFSKIHQKCLDLSLKDSIILLEVNGILDGKLSELNLQEIVKICYEKEAYLVLKNTQKLKQKELSVEKISNEFSTIEELHNNAIEMIRKEGFSEKEFFDMKKIAKQLLENNLEKHEDETNYHYEERVIESIKKICKI